MSVLIIFRKQLIPNRFNNLILGSISTGAGDNAIICSGFFQENVFSASQTTNLGNILRNNNVSLVTIGVYNNIWLQQYKTFRDNLIACQNSVLAKKMKGNKWHAKIFILKKGDNPIFGIIGSSNMTSNAFGLSGNFNFESDVVLWDNSLQKINSLCEGQNNVSDNNLDDIIFADYSLEKNRNKTPMDRLRDLENELNVADMEDFNN